jgi:hypothetical protein
MSMPEASANFDDPPARRKHHIRLAGQVMSVQAVSVSECVKHPADEHLGLGVLGTDCLHVAAAGIGDAFKSRAA